MVISERNECIASPELHFCRNNIVEMLHHSRLTDEWDESVLWEPTKEASVGKLKQVKRRIHFNMIENIMRNSVTFQQKGVLGRRRGNGKKHEVGGRE